MTISAEIVGELKEMFEEVSASYRKEKVSATCTGAFPQILPAEHMILEGSIFGTKTGTLKDVVRHADVPAESEFLGEAHVPAEAEAMEMA
jgi:hypothetical protein